MSFIEVKNITKRFDDKLVVDNISFGVEKGEIFGLIGPNGAGKSTLINIMTGILKANEGDVIIGGYNLKKEPLKVKELIGIVPQEIALMEGVNAYDNLEFFGSLYGLKGKLLKERINEALEITGLVDKKKEMLKKFSGGMKRRLNIAAAIMHHPEVLIMDEPTVGIDPQSRNHIFEFAKNICRERNTSVIYTSHYMQEVDDLCQDIFIIDLGREVACGTRDEIKRIGGHSNKVILDMPGYTGKLILELKNILGVKDIIEDDGKLKLLVEDSIKLNEILKKVEDMSFKVNGISYEELSLEEVFLSLTGKNLRD